MKTYAITKGGQWWTGSCWGVEQAAAEYSHEDLPGEIDLDNVTSGGATKFQCGFHAEDVVYTDAEGETVASVIYLGRAQDYHLDSPERGHADDCSLR